MLVEYLNSKSKAKVIVRVDRRVFDGAERMLVFVRTSTHRQLVGTSCQHSADEPHTSCGNSPTVIQRQITADYGN